MLVCTKCFCERKRSPSTFVEAFTDSAWCARCLKRWVTHDAKDKKRWADSLDAAPTLLEQSGTRPLLRSDAGKRKLLQRGA